ncbi:sortase domain-bontaining protein [Streptomyces sp. NPDC014889]|uniref:sortase domain-containing protein n=1 Tax=Streptomyces sp. NPDC014889 TaxID=3364928 RepID=UPI0036FA5D64
MSDHDGTPSRSRCTGRLLAGLAWVVLLLGLWLWGRDLTDVRESLAPSATGDMAAAGRPAADRPSAAAAPLTDAPPRRLDIPGLGLRAPVVTRGLDARGAVEPPPPEQSGTVAWYGAGVRPGASGTALLVGDLGAGGRPGAFDRIGSLRPGEAVRVVRDDGSVADFTVDDVTVLPRGPLDVRQASGARQPGRAELRLIGCGGGTGSTHGTGKESGGCTANVVVSAYLTSTGR